MLEEAELLILLKNKEMPQVGIATCGISCLYIIFRQKPLISREEKGTAQ